MAQVRYFVSDVAASVDFYVDALGFAVVQQFGAMAIVERDDLKVWLAGPDASASRPMPDGAVPAPGGWNRFALTRSTTSPRPSRRFAVGARASATTW